MVAGITKSKSHGEAINQVIEFPAEYGIKIMGLAEDGFDELVKSILLGHLDDNQPVVYSYKESGKQKYISITCTFIAKSRQQLDLIYAQMRANPKVLMVL